MAVIMALQFGLGDTAPVVGSKYVCDGLNEAGQVVTTSHAYSWNTCGGRRGSTRSSEVGLAARRRHAGPQPIARGSKSRRAPSLTAIGWATGARARPPRPLRARVVRLLKIEAS
eukprot:5710099-Pyramimonas_sp.AAC.1